VTVFTFYEPIPGFAGDAELLEVWRQSWQKAGWRPVVLNLDVARAHPRFTELRQWFGLHFHKVNDARYSWCCFSRWLALETMGGGLMMDYDVVNYGWPPRAILGDLVRFNWTTSCMIQATPAGVARIVEHLCRWVPGPEEWTSDMWSLNALFQSSDCRMEEGVLSEAGNADWDKAPVVHYCTRGADLLGIPRAEKAARIPGLRKL